MTNRRERSYEEIRRDFERMAEEHRREFEEVRRDFDVSAEELRREFEDAVRRLASHRRRRRPGGSELGTTPVEPNRPRGLSGGTEAPLEFDN